MRIKSFWIRLIFSIVTAALIKTWPLFLKQYLKKSNGKKSNGKFKDSEVSGVSCAPSELWSLPPHSVDWVGVHVYETCQRWWRSHVSEAANAGALLLILQWAFFLVRTINKKKISNGFLKNAQL